MVPRPDTGFCSNKLRHGWTWEQVASFPARCIYIRICFAFLLWLPSKGATPGTGTHIVRLRSKALSPQHPPTVDIRQHQSSGEAGQDCQGQVWCGKVSAVILTGSGLSNHIFHEHLLDTSCLPDTGDTVTNRAFGRC